MSITRVMLPVYLFGYNSNFVAVAFPAFKPDPGLCMTLVLWVGAQAAVLIMQMKWGTRFFIPAKFLPTPFDYSRPIPPALLAQWGVKADGKSLGGSSSSSSEGGDIETGTSSTYARLPPPRSRDLSEPDENTRLRSPSDSSGPQAAGLADDGALDCVICCSPVDISDRSGYMLAPCEHIFHRSCLTTWMDVKMECPTCRGNLPAI